MPTVVEIHDSIVEDGPINPLNSAYEIEDALNILKTLEKDIEFLKGLKKHRLDQYDAEISSKNNRINRLREIILRTMQLHEPDQKTLRFPAIGKVSRRDVRETYEIEDEEALLEYFDENGRRSEVIKVKESLDVKVAKALVENLIDEGKQVPGVKKVPAKEGISVSFEEKDRQAPARATKTTGKVVNQPAGRKTLTVDDLDELDL